ncbi:hypothetical protein D3C72_2549390 [compost metagenome]
MLWRGHAECAKLLLEKITDDIGGYPGLSCAYEVSASRDDDRNQFDKRQLSVVA